VARYLLGRLGQTLFTLWAAYTLSFAVLFALPSDPVSVLAGPDSRLTEPELDAIRADLGLDAPLWRQYLERLGGLLHGDLGQSVQSRRDVAELLGEAWPPTVRIAAAGLLLGVVLGTALALVASLARRPWLEQTLMALPPLGIAVPSFWVGLLLLQQFSFRWHLFPAFGDEGFDTLVLPAVTLALPAGALIAQLLGQGLAAELRQGYAETARAKGVGRLAVRLRHALRNAVLPALTMTGLLVGGMLSGSVVVETVFARDGLGRLTATAVAQQDLPVVQGLVLLGAVVFAVANLLVDLLYPVLDPRVGRAGGRGPRRAPRPAGTRLTAGRAAGL
jgi:peptide/nickel transport system permease protein